MSWQGAVLVVLGGAIGSLLRWAAIFMTIQRLGFGFPWGTLAVNVVGSFAIGVVAAWAVGGAFGVTPPVRLFLATGVLGGFTTFSSFSLETLNLIREGAVPQAFIYVAGSVLLGLAAASAGMVVARWLAQTG
jgi:fluoride exporter